MTHYFKLQYKMANRQLTEFGLHPFLGYILLIVGFVGLSVFLFSKTGFAGFIYIFIALSILSRLSETKRNYLLKSTFPDTTYYTIRILENSLAALPFLLFLLVQASFIPFAILTFSAIVFAFVDFKSQLSFTIPTPFYKRPFEFIVGFRNTLLVILGAWFFTIMAITSGNFNLGIFSLLLIFFVSFTFYSIPEPDFYVWIFTLSPLGFLKQKIITALLFSTMLSLPVTLGMSIFFSDKIMVILGFQALCYVYLSATILAKYSVFPNQMNVPQLVLIAVSIAFPPMLLGVIPYFYLQSVNRLKALL
jgi:hypothetical protein